METGLSEEEKYVVGHLTAAWNALLRIHDLGKDDREDFRRSLHECQRIIMSRIVARDYPGYWRKDE